MEHGEVNHLSPEGLHRNPAYSQVVTATGRVRHVFIGGQNAVSADGRIVGEGDLAAQALQVAKNLEVALAAGGAELRHVVRWNIFVVDGHPIHQAYQAFQESWGQLDPPPLLTVVVVSGLAHPDFLIEISGEAIVPLPREG